MTTDGYSRFTTTENVLITGIVNAAERPFSLHPNPVEDYLYLNAPENVRYPIRIINAAGHVVQTISKHHGAEPISVSELPAGFYIVATARYRVKMFKK